ncbi:hypothetical protein K440DRAFT_639289 [Wilcoxina mikolae CBS 423.85]|nr:hypothetical protein K440DRAFT_639289 [Wilcoxina mikolae CBS 423.85]
MRTSGRMLYFSLLVVTLSTIAIFLSLLTLCLLWDPTNKSHPERLWSNLSITGWTTRVITIGSTVIRFGVSFQIVLAFSMMASILLVRNQILYADAARVAMARVSGSGPGSIIFPTLRGRTEGKESWSMGYIIVIMLLLLSGLFQFTSTILVSDLRRQDFPGVARTSSIPYRRSNESPSLYGMRMIGRYLDEYPIFAEKPGESKSIVSADRARKGDPAMANLPPDSFHGFRNFVGINFTSVIPFVLDTSTPTTDRMYFSLTKLDGPTLADDIQAKTSDRHIANPANTWVLIFETLKGTSADWRASNFTSIPSAVYNSGGHEWVDLYDENFGAQLRCSVYTLPKFHHVLFRLFIDTVITTSSVGLALRAVLTTAKIDYNDRIPFFNTQGDATTQFLHDVIAPKGITGLCIIIVAVFVHFVTLFYCVYEFFQDPENVIGRSWETVAQLKHGDVGGRCWILRLPMMRRIFIRPGGAKESTILGEVVDKSLRFFENVRSPFASRDPDIEILRLHDDNPDTPGDHIPDNNPANNPGDSSPSDKNQEEDITPLSEKAPWGALFLDDKLHA